MGLRRRLSLTLSALLACSLLPVVPAVGVEESSPSSDPLVVDEPSPAEDQPPLPPEWIQAAESGEPVEIVDRRTSDSRTLVNPDGTLTTELYSGTEFVWEADPELPDEGRLERVDVTLVDDGATVAPRRVAGKTSLSRGGSGQLASVENAGRMFAIGWPASLPTPVLDGAVATYKGVANNTDLEVEATPGGFKWRLVLHTRTAKPIQLDIPLTLAGLSASQTATGQLA